MKWKQAGTESKFSFPFRFLIMWKSLFSSNTIYAFVQRITKWAVHTCHFHRFTWTVSASTSAWTLKITIKKMTLFLQFWRRLIFAQVKKFSRKSMPTLIRQFYFELTTDWKIVVQFSRRICNELDIWYVGKSQESLER